MHLLQMTSLQSMQVSLESPWSCLPNTESFSLSDFDTTIISCFTARHDMM